MSVDSGKTRRSLALAAAAAAVVSVAACSTGGDDAGESSSTIPPTPFTSPTDVDTWSFPVPSRPTTPTAPTTLPAGIDVDRSSADSVALAAAKVWYGWDTTTDTSPFDAALRATPLMGPKCRAQTLASAPQGSPGADWTALARVHAKARVEVAIGSEERPADRGDSASRVIGVKQSFTADKPVDLRRPIAMVVLTRTNGRWELGAPQTRTCGVVTR